MHQKEISMARRTTAPNGKSDQGHSDLGAKIHEVVSDACEFAGCDVNKVEDYVRDQPQKSLLIAFAVGFAASLFLRRK
jgi:ElaB/YqjD/DUF883 family membrane-anchored ribosome-binding protein